MIRTGLPMPSARPISAAMVDERSVTSATTQSASINSALINSVKELPNSGGRKSNWLRRSKPADTAASLTAVRTSPRPLERGKQRKHLGLGVSGVGTASSIKLDSTTGRSRVATQLASFNLADTKRAATTGSDQREPSSPRFEPGPLLLLGRARNAAHQPQ